MPSSGGCGVTSAGPARRPQGESKEYTFENAGCAATILCILHKDMEAYVVVLQNPYYALTGSDGSFTINDVPAGEVHAEDLERKAEGRADRNHCPGIGDREDRIQPEIGETDMESRSHGTIRFGRGSLILGAMTLGAGLGALPGLPPREALAAAPDTLAVVVTPVQGPSWLHRLGLQVSDTRMGEMGGTEPAPEANRREPALGGSAESGLRGAMHRFLSFFNSDRSQADEAFHATFELTGADLYRLNCQSCHGPDGKGAPPEINSLLGPVRGSTVAGIQQEMAAKDRTIPDDLAKQLAAQSEKDLLDRLQNGGKKMPPFRHLRGDEVKALLAYLHRLAGVPAGDRASMPVPQSAARVGEHVVKGTCQICHDATGPGGRGMGMMMSGTIPSLQSLPRDDSLDAVLHQVAYGSSGMTGMMGGGQRMPALPYFTPEEIAAAYFYLDRYAPEP